MAPSYLVWSCALTSLTMPQGYRSKYTTGRPSSSKMLSTSTARWVGSAAAPLRIVLLAANLFIYSSSAWVTTQPVLAVVHSVLCLALLCYVIPWSALFWTATPSPSYTDQRYCTSLHVHQDFPAHTTPYPLPDWYPRASAAAWKRFWKAPWPHYTRTILWRAYHRKLPCRERLHHLHPTAFTTLNCPLCHQLDNGRHFLWDCPKKQRFGKASPDAFFNNHATWRMRIFRYHHRHHHHYATTSLTSTSGLLLPAPSSLFGTRIGALFSMTSLFGPMAWAPALSASYAASKPKLTVHRPYYVVVTFHNWRYLRRLNKSLSVQKKLTQQAVVDRPRRSEGSHLAYPKGGRWR